jgi:hypothetical protein
MVRVPFVYCFPASNKIQVFFVIYLLIVAYKWTIWNISYKLRTSLFESDRPQSDFQTCNTTLSIAHKILIIIIIIIIMLWRFRCVILFLNSQDEVGPSISSSVVLCSFVRSVYVVVLVSVSYWVSVRFLPLRILRVFCWPRDRLSACRRASLVVGLNINVILTYLTFYFDVTEEFSR